MANPTRENRPALGLTGLIEGLLGRRPAKDGGRRGFELCLDADDITTIWRRYPGLDPAAGREDLPAGVPLLTAETARRLGADLAPTADAIAAAATPAVHRLAADWAAAGMPDAWPLVADVLVGAMGLGCEVARRLPWRAPAVFGVDFAEAGWADPADRPPFLRLTYLAGSGKAGIMLLSGRAWPAADELIHHARSREFATTWADYQGRDGELVGYGLAVRAMLTAGILRRERAGPRSQLKLQIPVLGPAELAKIEAPWRVFVAALAEAVAGQAREIEAAAAEAFGSAGYAATEDPAERADFLDQAYFVLADLVYEGLSAAGVLETPTQGGAAAAASRGTRVRALLLEEPATIWARLTLDKTEGA